MAQKNTGDQAPTRVPTYEEAMESLGRQPATEAGRQSIDASEEIRRIQRSNPPAKAQALVSSFLQQLKGN